MEPIKQEIINNIFENGDKLITGPILQTVLIDMIDDVNVKDQEILSKTGSWDDAVTQIPNLATKAEVTNLSESVARDLTGYATETWVESQGYLKEHQDISNLATKTELNDTKNNLQGNITSLSESVARDLASVPEGVATEAWVQSQDYASKSYVDNAVSSSSVDLTGYATETWVESQGYLKEHQDISNLATKGELNDTKSTLESNLNNLSSSVSNDIQNKGEEVKTWVQSQGYLTEHQDISNLATKAELTSVSESVQTDITNLSESVANSAVWKKGTGTDSIVQVLTGADKPYTSIATGKGAVAIGRNVQASGDYSHAEGRGTGASGLGSHAEGQSTRVSGDYSHAEGYSTLALRYYSHAEGYRTTASRDGSHAEGEFTIASGSYSHAEGGYTNTSNEYEHAQGRYNYTSSNQIFSIGTGNSDTDRRNAVSVLEVDNSGSYTGSFFVQNIGGYDGTNPEPGTNDLATVINGMSSGGGSSETLWKKGTGTDSIAQVIAKGTNPPSATGERAIATGQSTYASGESSHAEGHLTNASGWTSHAEGFYTKASNPYEHAQGIYNHSSENQIFSIGIGNSNTDRRNAVSVLAVDNSGSYTASFFVQNVGGYDGTNPTPGTNDLATVINGMSSGGGSSEVIWKKGTGKDSAVLILTGADEAKTPTATGTGSIATGEGTKASGKYSHAEGEYANASGTYSHAEGCYTGASGRGSHAEGKQTVAEGSYSHAEGQYTKAGHYSHAEGDDTNASGFYSHAEGHYAKAKGDYSHAEGGYTTASNDYEHAQGRYNHSSTNQIFSIGTGNSDTDRRNAVSVLEVSNNNSYTSSFFVQNIGGYDGTNPLPGTNDLATVINGLSSGGGSSSGGSSETLWKKGEGKDSIVQKVTDTTLTEPIASGIGAVAIGDRTKASGQASHAEGYWTEAKGNHSHAEGRENTAEGVHSHTEGFNTIASNDYEHAQGIRNYSSTNQIFSVGAGDYTGDYVEASNRRRNAISVLAVPNSDTQVVTASFFVQNIGGYDGTNPTPGTNDLATVINSLSSGGTSTETWTFTLEDGSTVTKNIVMR